MMDAAGIRVGSVAFPWVRFLPEDAAHEFLLELAETTRGCAAANTFDQLDTTIAAWKHTAEIYANSELYEHLTRPIDLTEDCGPVAAPEAPA